MPCKRALARSETKTVLTAAPSSLPTKRHLTPPIELADVDMDGQPHVIEEAAERYALVGGVDEACP